MNYFSKENVEIPRTPQEFVDWMEKFNQLYTLKDRQHWACTSPEYKFYKEELLPLKALLKSKLDIWMDARFLPINGNQQYDVQIIKDEHSKIDTIPDYIEITWSRDGMLEHIIDELVQKEGHYTSTGQKKVNEKGQTVGFTPGWGSVEARFIEAIEYVEASVIKKLRKSYPSHTALLIQVDGIFLRDDDELSPNFICSYFKVREFRRSDYPDRPGLLKNTVLKHKEELSKKFDTVFLSIYRLHDYDIYEIPLKERVDHQQSQN